MVGCCRLVLVYALTVGLAKETWSKEQSAPTSGATQPGRERFEHADVLYGWVTNSRGDQLRTFITRPNKIAGKVPAVFFVGWLSCDSVEYPNGETDGFGALIRRIIDQSGYATMRVEKPGVGESRGTRCEQADFQSELEGYQAGFDAMRKYDFVDPDRIFVVGISNGGGVAPLVARQHRVAGFVAAGSWGRTWYEHMLEHERRRLGQSGKSPAEVNQAVKDFIELYNLFLIRGMTPGEILKQRPEWKALWYDGPEGQYGRPAKFYQQLQTLNLGLAWQQVSAPVLVIRGTSDDLMSRADGEAIAESVNRAHPGLARYIEIEQMTHGFNVNKKFHADLVPEILSSIRQWLQQPK